MCEFNVSLEGREVFNDVVFAVFKEGNVILSDVLGYSKEFKNCQIIRIDVNSQQLILASIQE